MLWKLGLVVLVLAGLSLILKLCEVPTEWGAGKRWLTMAGSDPGGTVPSYYGRSDYAIVDGLKEIPQALLDDKTLFVAVAPHRRLTENPTGEVNVGVVYSDTPMGPGPLVARTLVLTQVQPFPWAHLLLDGAPLDPRDLYFYRERADPKKVDYAVSLLSGKHELTFQFDPPAWWYWARMSSFLGAGAWGLWLIRKGLQKI
jgi:hypothetical protein